MGYPFRLVARVLLHASYHRLEWEIAQWIHHEGSIWWPITQWGNTLTTELHIAPYYLWSRCGRIFNWPFSINTNRIARQRVQLAEVCNQINIFINKYIDVKNRYFIDKKPNGSLMGTDLKPTPPQLCAYTTGQCFVFQNCKKTSLNTNQI